MSFNDHWHALNTDEQACPDCGAHLYEVEVNGRFVKVTASIFRSWTGRRRMDGWPYDGPVIGYLEGARR